MYRIFKLIRTNATAPASAGHKGGRQVKWNKTGLTKDQTEAALKALNEGRLAFKVLDQYGRNTNTYGAPQIQYHLPKNGKPGKWMPKIENVFICERGYHVTTSPAQWAGCTVWLAEYRGEGVLVGDKTACETIRILGQIHPDSCIELALLCRLLFPYLSGAYLSGADLSGAYLSGADLSGADLSGANVSRPDRSVAGLSGADISAADRSWPDLT